MSFVGLIILAFLVVGHGSALAATTGGDNESRPRNSKSLSECKKKYPNPTDYINCYNSPGGGLSNPAKERFVPGNPNRGIFGEENPYNK